MNARIYPSADEITFRREELPQMPAPKRVLMVRPDFFNVEYVINPHMSDKIGTVDKTQAEKEWTDLLSGFKQTGLDVVVLEGQPGLPDMVFSANQCLPYSDKEGHKKVIMSRMHSKQRSGEVPFIEQWFRQNGYQVHHLDFKNSGSFEGMGDGIWHFGRELLWGGYGFRTSRHAYDEIAEILQVPVILLELQNERFYHLDTCFCTLNEETVMIYPPAFNENGLEMIHSLYKTVVEVSRYEAEALFAANASCPDGKNVFIQQGSEEINQKLREHNFIVHELSTGEFLKSGGSIFCMKLLFW